MRGEIAKACLQMKVKLNHSLTVIAREGGRSSIPETSAIEPKSRGVLDTRLRGV
jgi:hypothetical protein